MVIYLTINVGLSKDLSMKKVVLSLIGCAFVTNSAFCDPYYLNGWNRVSGAAYTAWGSPSLSKSYIQDKTSGPGKFRIKEGWACCGSSAQDAENNNQDDQAIMAFIAKDIYEHGGWFCLTQLSVGSGYGGFPIYNQQPNWPGMQCGPLCEPGWDGPGCSQKTSADSPCNTTDFAAAIKEVQKSKYTGNDAFALHRQRMGTATTQDYFSMYWVNNFYQHAVYLGATDFMQHGIVAQPVLVAAVGNHPKITSITTGPAASGKTKVLCAQGFTKNEKCEISSKNCGSNVWCNGYSDSDFNSSKHVKQMSGFCNIIVCRDGSKALDSDFNCIDCDAAPNGRCDVAGHEMFGKCVKCSVGKIFDAATCNCADARSVSKDIMQYGKGGANSTVLEQCWTKEGTDDFQNCVLGITPAPAEEEKTE